MKCRANSTRWTSIVVACCLAATGWHALAAKSPAASKSEVAKVDEANALLDDWQLEDAKNRAEQILAEHPDNPYAWYLAGRVQHARGEHLSAVSLLRAAASAGVGEANSVLNLAEASARYLANAETLETPHFKIRYLNKDEILASYAAPVLESAYQGIGRALEFLPAERGEKIVVEIYPDARGLAGATGLTLHEIETSGTIAVCKFHRLMITSALATADGYDWADTVAHELVHLVVSKKSRDTIPIWLHEGIAKYFESAWKSALGEGLSAYSEKLLADAIRKKKFITYQQMHPSMAKLPSQQDAALAFAEVFITVEYLVRERGRASVPKVLALSADGLSLEEALHQVYGMGLKGIEVAWKRYLLRRPLRQDQRAPPRPIRLAANDTEASTDRPLEPMTDRQVHDFARLGELLQLRGHLSAAVVEYEKAYAKSGVIYVTLVYRLARAYLDTQRDAQALALLTKAAAAHPDESDIQLLTGRVRLSRNDLTGARQAFEAVRLHNPFIPEIHAALGKIYEAAGESEKAKREARFLELSSHMRPTRDYKLPPERSGSATLTIISVPFSDVRLDNGVLAAPSVHVPVAPGEHRIDLTLADGQVRSQTVTVTEAKTVVLR